MARTKHPKRSGDSTSAARVPLSATVEKQAAVTSEKCDDARSPSTLDLDPVRRLLFSWTLGKLLDTKPPSAVILLSRDDTIGTTARCVTFALCNPASSSSSLCHGDITITTRLFLPVFSERRHRPRIAGETRDTLRPGGFRAAPRILWFCVLPRRALRFPRWFASLTRAQRKRRRPDGGSGG